MIGLVFQNKCTATIEAPTVRGKGAADICGFQRYDPTSPGTTPSVAIDFHAQHPHNFAYFSFEFVPGATHLQVAGSLARK